MYHPLKLKLSLAEARKLMRGLGVKIHRRHIGKGIHNYHLTQSQHKKMQMTHLLNVPHMLKLSMAQIRHHAKHGGSLFSWISGVANKIASVVKPYVRPVLKGVARAGLARVGLDGVLGGLSDRGVDALSNKIGVGRMRRHSMHSRSHSRVGTGVRRRRTTRRGTGTKKRRVTRHRLSNKLGTGARRRSHRRGTKGGVRRKSHRRGTGVVRRITRHTASLAPARGMGLKRHIRRHTRIGRGGLFGV